MDILRKRRHCEDRITKKEKSFGTFLEEQFKEKKRIKDRKREEIWKEKNLMDKNIGELLAKRIQPWYLKKRKDDALG
jgi:hypothetical protein